MACLTPKTAYALDMTFIIYLSPDNASLSHYIGAGSSTGWPSTNLKGADKRDCFSCLVPSYLKTLLLLLSPFDT